MGKKGNSFEKKGNVQKMFQLLREAHGEDMRERRSRIRGKKASSSSYT